VIKIRIWFVAGHHCRIQ